MNAHDNVQTTNVPNLNAQTTPSTNENTMSTPIQSTQSSPTLEDRFIAAFKRREAAIAAVPDAELMHTNLDVPTAYTTILGASPRLVALRDEIVRELPSFDPSVVDGLVDDALALSSAHARWTIATQLGASLPETMAEAMKQRDRLYVHAGSFVDAGFFHRANVDEIRSTGSYRGVSFEIISLVQLFSDHWAEIAAKSLLSREEILAASAVADRLTAQVAERDARPKATAAATLVRDKAFTLLVRHYDEVRRAVGYLRWNAGDADTLAPSLYAGRNNGNHKAPKPSDVAVAEAATTTPAKATQPEPVPADALPALPNARPFLTAVNA